MEVGDQAAESVVCPRRQADEPFVARVSIGGPTAWPPGRLAIPLAIL